MQRCPACRESKKVKNGHVPRGKQRHRCVSCGRQYVENPTKQRISDEKKGDVDRLLLARVSLAGIARVVQVSESWLQEYVNKKYEGVSCTIGEPPESERGESLDGDEEEKEEGKEEEGKEGEKLTIECDEAWSFVQNKGAKFWIWLAIDRASRRIVGCHIGDRSAVGAQKLWDSMPRLYREKAHCFTDFWEAYGKEKGNTNHIERFNGTMRARIGRLVRPSYSFSKKLQNHVAAIWNFIHHYNLAISS